MASHQTAHGAADGTIETGDGRLAIRFERRFAHPVEQVWEALTRPEQIAQWYGTSDIELELAEGGRFEVRTTGPSELVDAVIAEAGKEALVQHNTVLRVEPPLLFAHTFGAPDSIVNWELQRDGGGCRLVLTHTEPAGFVSADAPRDLAGWHALLDLLDEVLTGNPVEWTKARWEEHRDRYAARLR